MAPEGLAEGVTMPQEKTHDADDRMFPVVVIFTALCSIPAIGLYTGRMSAKAGFVVLVVGMALISTIVRAMK